MESLYYNLSEEEFSKGRKVLLWVFAFLFFVGGLFVLSQSIIFGHKSIKPSLSIAPFGICAIITFTATLATRKRKDLFFSVSDEKIEFRYGLIKPKLKSFNWIDIKELVMPHKQRMVKLVLINGTSFVIDLTWLQRKKSSIIKKHIYHAAHHKNLNVIKVIRLP